MIERGDADALVVAKVDRLSRSLLDFAGIVERSRKQDWQLVALDLGVDTTTPQGEMLASVLAVFAQFERRLIGERTKDALAVKRANGVQLGRPRSLPRSVVRRITRARTRGETWSAIADELNRDEVPTAQGGRQWWPATVRKIAQTA
jgi:DNA invertase Pin-like site-specific DNA recombinase